MFALAIDGIISLSIKPIRIITLFGLMMFIVSGIAVIWSLVCYFKGYSITDWTGSVGIMLFLNDIQMLSLGVIGEYIGKTYLEAKRRPRYIISERTSDLINNNLNFPTNKTDANA